MADRTVNGGDRDGDDSAAAGRPGHRIAVRRAPHARTREDARAGDVRGGGTHLRITEIPIDDGEGRQ